jgi:hypothetical protein
MFVDVTDHPSRFLRALRVYGGGTCSASPSTFHSAPPIEERPERLAWGMAQPVVALRLLWSNRDLLMAALIPPFWLAVACATMALTKADSPLGYIKRFYLTFAALAPLPTVIFARHYARFAANVRMRMGFGECKPRIEPFRTSMRRVMHGFIMISIAPVILLLPLTILPGPVKIVSAALTAVWALHWIVVDALDNAQVIVDGRPPPKSPAPWFVRMTRDIKSVSRLLDRFSKFWREEIEIIEQHRLISLGFGLATAALLATPVLNLFFRPITIAAAVHLSGDLESHSSIAATPLESRQ